MQIRTFKVLASSLGFKESDSTKGQPLAIEYQETTVGKAKTLLPLSFLPLTNKKGELYPIQNVKRIGRPTLSTTINLQRANLSGMNFTGLDLSRGNLQGANLTEATLSDTNLTTANLQNAKLTRADLRKANLTTANLYFADLNGADLRMANLKGATLTNVKFSRDTTKF